MEMRKMIEDRVPEHLEIHLSDTEETESEERVRKAMEDYDAAMDEAAGVK